MTTDLQNQLDHLGDERRRLEALLERHPAWLALTALGERAPPSSPTDAAARQRHRVELERQLEGNPIYEAQRSVVAAMAMIEDLLLQSTTGSDAGSGEADAISGGKPPTTADLSMNASESRPAPVFSPSQMPAPDARADGGEATPPLTRGAQPAHTTVELLSLGRSRGGGIVTRAAKIHAVPPGSATGVRDDRTFERGPDDLTRIRRIDRALAAALMARGVKRFEQIAAFGPADVRSLAAALNLGRRISQENWIEQAAVLAFKEAAAAIASRGVSVGSTTHSANPLVEAPAGKAPASARGIAPSAEQAAAIAARIKAPIAVQTGAGMVPPPEPESVGQPAILRISSDVADPPKTEPRPASAALVRDIAVRLGERMRRLRAPDRTTGEAEVPTDTPSSPLSKSAAVVPARPIAADDLTRISGINAEAAAVLGSLGITRYEDLATCDPARVRLLRDALAHVSAAERAGWIEQAAMLAVGGTTAFARRHASGILHACVPRPPDINRADPEFAAWLSRQSFECGQPLAVLAMPTLASEPSRSETALDSCAVAEHAGSYPDTDEASVRDGFKQSILPDQAESETGATEVRARAVLVDELYGDAEPAFEAAASGKKAPELDVAKPPQIDVADETAASFSETAARTSTTPPARRSAVVFNIADRITAIERDAENLQNRSFEAKQSAAKGVVTEPHPAQPYEPVSSKSPHHDRGDAQPEEAENVPVGAEDREAEISTADEADVRIVMREAHDLGLDRRARGEPGSQSEIISDGADNNLGGQAYSAYRDRIEEASVEIIRPAADDATVTDGDIVGGRTGASGKAKDPSPSEAGAVRRFLNALKGEQP